jgi:shikimate kinase
MTPGRIVLVGSMGAGKTTVGRALAARLGWPYWDNDAELHRLAGAPVTKVAAEGTERLHAVEAAVLRAALAAPPPLVVAAPGSAALDPSLADALAGERVVWLRASLATLAARVADGPARPLLGAAPGPVTPVAALDAARRPGFAALATQVVDVDGVPVEEIVDAIVASLDGEV